MKEGIVRYVKICKKIFQIFSLVAIPALMVFLVFALNAEGMAKTLFICLAAGTAALWFIAYGFYAMRISLGAVTEVSYNDKVVYLKTPRKTYTYDVLESCVDMKVYKNKFVGTFETQNSRDKFIFYRKTLFSRLGEGCFTANDLRPFYPLIDGEQENS